MKNLNTQPIDRKKELRRAREQRWRDKHREKFRANRNAYNKKNREKIKQKDKEYYEKRKSIKSLTDKAWRERNKERCAKNALAWYYSRIEVDPLYVLKCRLRAAVYASFKRIKQNKPTDTLTLLGCNWEEAKAHFENLFKDGMSWNNHGKWHIDHIRPVDDWKLDELHLMNHISNLQPLWALDNILKSDSYLPFTVTM